MRGAVRGGGGVASWADPEEEAGAEGRAAGEG